ncbi:DUF3152 domain-containing protein [Streptomyces sp. NBC_00385]|uniref:DUF3152 domain-containing protein n=1 Tax=Streptomyces sp. NBC_00385 TaxID=2975733 RepID=UPI002DDA8939|nr:DUF3152 domain-containing protein [Streptomyces sp. NBC_00385]WRZ04606.1 DUF3152 domain-containing protein [Streptomyces sp. NBC_00385]
MAADRGRHQASSRGRGRRRSRQKERRGRIRALAAVLVPAALIGVVVIAAPRWAGGDDPSAAAAAPEPSDARPGPAPARTSPSPAAKPKGKPKPATVSPSPSPSVTAMPPRIPASGPGTFTVARAGTSSGGGNAYRVEVEDGSGVDPDTAAALIADVLAAPRGWAHGGARSFHQVAEGPAGMVVRIATPATTDRICGADGLNTHGEVNCRVGEKVMVNLKRWQTGSPEFHGPLDEYRALIINHEVGHWLGHGHETCPGKGRPAPAMMQQIYGLKGCVANAWPYDAAGQYLGGPSVP